MTRTRINLALAFCLCLCVTATAQTGDVFGATSEFKTRQLKPMAADLLLKSVERVDWEDTTFEEVLDWIRAESEDQINVIPRWNALAVVGVDSDSLVTLKLTDTTIAEVLNEVLDQIAPGAGLGYRAKSNALRISSNADFGRKLEVRAYNILDLVFDIPDFGRSFPAVDLEAASRAGGSGSGGGGQSIFGGSSSQSDELEVEDQEIEEQVDELIILIASTIDPASWGVVPAAGGSNTQLGGTGPGTIRAFNNRTLIVYNTVEVHEKIAGFFADGQ